MSSRISTTRKGTLATVSALLVAIVSSACCWLPLLLLAFGLSGGVVAASFESWRPVMLPVTFVLLALGWYFSLKPVCAGSGDKDSCSTPAEGSASCCPPEKTGFSVQKLNLVMLGIATVTTVAFAFFPNYVGALVSTGSIVESAPDTESVVLTIEGMTCAGCEIHVVKSLEGIDGVVVTDVDHASGRAEAQVPLGTDRGLLRQAIDKAGYEMTGIESQLQSP